MAYDEDLAWRVRAVLPPAEAMTERQMFGGLAFMLGGHMFCGVVRDTLMVRLGPEGADRALNQPHVRPMDFTGRPMKGMVFVEPGGLRGAALGEWVAAAAAFARAPRQLSAGLAGRFQGYRLAGIWHAASSPTGLLPREEDQ